MAQGLEKIKQWFRRTKADAEEQVDRGSPVATPPDDHSGDPERETSTNAQTAGASDEPWPGSG